MLNGVPPELISATRLLLYDRASDEDNSDTLAVYITDDELKAKAAAEAAAKAPSTAFLTGGEEGEQAEAEAAEPPAEGEEAPPPPPPPLILADLELSTENASTALALENAKPLMGALPLTQLHDAAMLALGHPAQLRQATAVAVALSSSGAASLECDAGRTWLFA